MFYIKPTLIPISLHDQSIVTWPERGINPEVWVRVKRTILWSTGTSDQMIQIGRLLSWAQTRLKQPQPGNQGTSGKCPCQIEAIRHRELYFLYYLFFYHSYLSCLNIVKLPLISQLNSAQLSSAQPISERNEEIVPIFGFAYKRIYYQKMKISIFS